MQQSDNETTFDNLFGVNQAKTRWEAIFTLFDDLVFDVKFAINEYREIVKNYLAEIHISDGSSDEAFIGNLQTT